MRTITRTVAALAVTAGVALAPAGIANASTAATPPPPAPTACAPENVDATVAPAVSTGKSTVYTVRLVAHEGTAPCGLNGWPHPVEAAHDGVPQWLPYVGPGGGSASAVEFGPGSPAAFDIVVQGPDAPQGRADTVEFTASSTFEQIPGRFVATGELGIGPDMWVSSVYDTP
jgi:hypothetical protein